MIKPEEILSQNKLPLEQFITEREYPITELVRKFLTGRNEKDLFTTAVSVKLDENKQPSDFTLLGEDRQDYLLSIFDSTDAIAGANTRIRPGVGVKKNGHCIDLVAKMPVIKPLSDEEAGTLGQIEFDQYRSDCRIKGYPAIKRLPAFIESVKRNHLNKQAESLQAEWEITQKMIGFMSARGERQYPPFLVPQILMKHKGIDSLIMPNLLSLGFQELYDKPLVIPDANLLNVDLPSVFISIWNSLCDLQNLQRYMRKTASDFALRGKGIMFNPKLISEKSTNPVKFFDIAYQNQVETNEEMNKNFSVYLFGNDRSPGILPAFEKMFHTIPSRDSGQVRVDPASFIYTRDADRLAKQIEEIIERTRSNQMPGIQKSWSEVKIS